MDVGKAFTFVTEDERWTTKIGIGAAVSFFSFLILPIFLLVGYMIGVTRNVKDGNPNPLPEWDDWGQLFLDGLYTFIAQLVYTLPFWLLVCIGGGVTIAAGGISEVSEGAAAAAIITTWGVVGCLLLLLMIALFFVSPAIVIQYVRTDDFGAMFRFGEVLTVARENVGNILIVAIASFAVSLALSIVFGIMNVIIPCLGSVVSFIIGIVASPWITAAVGHMYGQIAANMEKMPPKPVI